MKLTMKGQKCRLAVSRRWHWSEVMVPYKNIFSTFPALSYLTRIRALDTFDRFLILAINDCGSGAELVSFWVAVRSRGEWAASKLEPWVRMRTTMTNAAVPMRVIRYRLDFWAGIGCIPPEARDLLDTVKRSLAEKTLQVVDVKQEGELLSCWSKISHHKRHEKHSFVPDVFSLGLGFSIAENDPIISRRSRAFRSVHVRFESLDGRNARL